MSVSSDPLWKTCSCWLCCEIWTKGKNKKTSPPPLIKIHTETSCLNSGLKKIPYHVISDGNFATCPIIAGATIRREQEVGREVIDFGVALNAGVATSIHTEIRKRAHGQRNIDSPVRSHHSFYQSIRTCVAWLNPAAIFDDWAQLLRITLVTNLTVVILTSRMGVRKT